MKNKLNFLIVIAIMVFVMGCTCGNLSNLGSQEAPAEQPKTSDSGSKSSDSTSNKSLTDRATDVVTTGEKIGIQECDEVMDSFRAKIENENTDVFTKAILKTLEAQFRQSIKESIEKNQTDRDATARFCKELKKQLDEQTAKQGK